MNSIEKKDQLIGFLKNIEPIVKFLKKINNNELIGLIFAAIFFIVLVGFWYWVCFMNGAQAWSNGMVNYYKRIGLPISKYFSSPSVLKIVITIFLLCTIVGFSAVILSLLSN